MQVNDTRKKYNTPFELIKVGETFSWRNAFWMRTRSFKSCGVWCNVINIENGDFACFENSDVVEKLDTELTIR